MDLILSKDPSTKDPIVQLEPLMLEVGTLVDVMRNGVSFINLSFCIQSCRVLCFFNYFGLKLIILCLPL